MSNRTLTRYWRDRWPGERLSDAQLAALAATPKPPQRLARLLRGTQFGADPLDNVEIALLTQPAAWNAPLNPAIELAGRGYARPPVGPLTVTGPGPWKWQNSQLILWPQAKDDWGLAQYIALLQTGEDTVLAAAAIATPPFAVVAGDQPRIAPGGLTIGGVAPNTARPYGAGRYGESLYGGWPADGAVFFVTLDAIGYQWAALAGQCAPWTDLTVYSGGCRG